MNSMKRQKDMTLEDEPPRSEDIQYAAAAAKVLQSCPTLCDPIDGSPPGSPILGILQARTLEWANMLLGNSKEIAPERMKRLDQSGKDAQLWMCLVVKVKSSMLKSRDITLLTKVYIVKAMVFPAVMNRCESWTIKKAEC